MQAAWKHPVVRVAITVTEGPPAQVTASKLAALQASLSGRKPAAPPQQRRPPDSPLAAPVKGRAPPAAPPPPPPALRSTKSMPAQHGRPQPPPPAPPARPEDTQGLPQPGAGPVAVHMRLESQETCEGEHSFAVRLSGFRDEARQSCGQLAALAAAVMVRSPVQEHARGCRAWQGGAVAQ